MMRIGPSFQEGLQPLNANLSPTVSIIVPCYNHGKLIAETVRSIACQTFTDWECIIVNDGSTDNSEEIILALAEKDDRIRYFRQPNKGPSGARNLALDKIRGKYVQFLDADDILDPPKLDLQVAQLSNCTDLAIAYCDFRWCDEEGNELQRYLDSRHRIDESNPLHDVALYWQHQIIIPPCCFIFDARFFTERGIRENESIRANEDYDLLLRVLALKPRLIFDDRKLAAYRIVPGSVSQNIPRIRSTYFDILRDHTELFSHDSDMLAILKRKKKLVKHDWMQAAPVWELGWWIYRLRLAARLLLPEGVKRSIKERLRGV